MLGLKINRSEITRILKPLEQVSDTDQKVHSVLRSVYMRHDGTNLTLQSTNNIGWAEFVIECEGEEGFELCLPAKEFAKAIRSFDAEILRIDHDDTWKSLLRCGKSILKIPGEDPSIFPTKKESEDFDRCYVASRTQLASAIAKVYHAIEKSGSGKATSRGQAVHFHIGEPETPEFSICKVLASDMDRFAVSKIMVEPKKGKDDPIILVIPEDENDKSVSVLLSILQVGQEDEINIETDESMITFTSGGVSYQCRLKDSPSFKMERVTQVSEARGGFAAEVKLPKVAFISILSRARDWGEDKIEKSNRTFFASKGNLILVKSMVGDGSYKFSDEIEVKDDLPEFFLSVFSDYTLDAAVAIGSPEVLLSIPNEVPDDNGLMNPGPFRMKPADEEEQYEEWYMPTKMNDPKTLREALDL